MQSLININLNGSYLKELLKMGGMMSFHNDLFIFRYRSTNPINSFLKYLSGIMPAIYVVVIVAQNTTKTGTKPASHCHTV